MGLYINQKESRTDLQERIAADLRAKALKKMQPEGEKRDGVEDSLYLENTKRTTSLDWAWALIAVAIVVIFILFIVRTN